MPDLHQRLDQLRSIEPLIVLLDYDGTLVPFAARPELAAPDPPLLELLNMLARRPHMRTHLLSGRSRATCDAWFGHLSLELSAEHGLWYRPAQALQWILAVRNQPSDMPVRIQPLLAEFTAATPGSRLELKSTSMAWHYRRVDCALAANRVRALRLELGHALTGTPFEILEGQQVIEVRPRGISKALVVDRVLGAGDGSDVAVFLAMGDDQTDEAVFCRLPPSAVTIAVGNVARGATYRVPDYRAARAILRRIVAPSS